MSYSVIIPARYGSSRLPGKLLANIVGKPMIQHVYEQACKSRADKVIIATDDERIRSAALGFDADVVMTREDHPTGTDRLQEVVARLKFSPDDIVVNVQGDEPLIPAAIIDQVAGNLAAHTEASVATLSHRIRVADDLFNPAVVKVVADGRGMARYFSRAVIPWDRDRFADGFSDHMADSPLYQRHIGIYAYRVDLLNAFVGWGVSPLEDLEKLEQLRVLWNGRAIHVAEAAELPPAGIDTEADLERVRQIVADRGLGVSA
ncbi:MAG: 3-deoxy-manno-octulosonate cytidylyltransferase [Endozoicomonadaceae bacterium]|nr:3-deoxy-manno-octulosonate cytidylyltransferase [Endozoicomonadaceae bacterium]